MSTGTWQCTPLLRLFAARALAALLAVVLGLGPACSNDADTSLPPVDERTQRVRADLAQLIEDGLQSELPPPMPREEQELYADTLYRQQIASRMADETASALAPLALAAAVFVPQGPADLVLSVFPAHHLGKAADVAKAAYRARKRNKRSRKLIELQERFEAQLSDDARSVFQLAQKLGRAEQRAITTLAQHTGSPTVVGTLLTRHVRNEVDLVWLADKLKRSKKVDGDFVRRFTFDADFVKEFTEYEAHLSWDVLQRMVENRLLDKKARKAMAGKLYGLLGERAAVDVVHGPTIVGKYFKNVASGDLNIARGMGYKTLYNREGSIDIIARTGGAAVYVEVKCLSAETWAKKGTDEILAQLQRHNRGIDDIRHRSEEWSSVAGKILMVADKGFLEGMAEKDQKTFKLALEQIGWSLELMPARNIPSVDTLIDSLR